MTASETKTLNVLITHQSPIEVAAMDAYWSRMTGCQSLIAYGGTRENFDRLELDNAVFIESDWIRTRRHLREKQSYMPVFAAVAERVDLKDFAWVSLAECDQIPIQQDVQERQIRYCEENRFDTIFYDLHRIDQTNYCMTMSHAGDAEWMQFLRKISLRSDPEVLLLGKGYASFWRSEVFREVAALSEEAPRAYLEIFMPTYAHHLGFRVGRAQEESPFCRVAPWHEDEVNAMVRNKAEIGEQWFIHPGKAFWLPSSIGGMRENSGQAVPSLPEAAAV